MKSKTTIYLILLLAMVSCDSKKEKFVADNFEFAAKQTNLMLDTTKGSVKIPRTIVGGKLYSSGIYDWTSGFFPGTLWYLYEQGLDKELLADAEEFTMRLEPIKKFTGNHDLGFMLYCSFGNGYRLTGNDEYKDILIEGAKSLSTRYIPDAGIIRSWNYRKNWNGKTEWWCPVIIDNMMNLELLFFASKHTGDSSFYDIAVTHARNTMKNHIREDYSSYHVVDYDTKTGAVLDRATCQGFSDNSTWARGQAWGIYGFTMTYRETKCEAFLKVAQGMADFYINNQSLPEDKIPYWDFNVNQEGYVPFWKYDKSRFTEIPRDASAAAVTASALFELATYVNEEDAKRYLEFAESTLLSLGSDSYRAKLGANSCFILEHSVGSIPHGVEIDVPLCYADYYFVEALHRYSQSKK